MNIADKIICRINNGFRRKGRASLAFERVFNTLNVSKKITVIPIVKDEGASGDKDFLSGNTVRADVAAECYAVVKASDAVVVATD